MTLILCLRAPNWVSMVSDRMMSRIEDGKPDRLSCTKMVLFFNDMVFGFTGYARMLDGRGQWRDTGTWLAEILIKVGKRSLPDALVAIRDSATESFDRMYRAGVANYRHAFLGVGWDRETYGPASLDAFSCCVSNYHHPDGSCWEGKPRYTEGDPVRNFHLGIDSFPQNDTAIAFSSIGYPQSPTEKEWLRKAMWKAIEQGKDGARLMDLMKQSIRQTSKRLRNRYVGSDILAAIIPREAAMSDRVLVSGPQSNCGMFFDNVGPPPGPPPVISRQECSYFLRYATGRDNGVYAAPHVVAPGFKRTGMWSPQDGSRGRISGSLVINANLKEAGAIMNPQVILTAKKSGRKKKNS
ncbi:MAG: hypothetical protein IAF94_14880 [Pirellulaceae bacterium]|nr:hypothetical protein [Pirellulaceae bacterium]